MKSRPFLLLYGARHLFTNCFWLRLFFKVIYNQRHFRTQNLSCEMFWRVFKCVWKCMELNGIIKRLAVYLQFRGQEHKRVFKVKWQNHKVFCKIKKKSSGLRKPWGARENLFFFFCCTFSSVLFSFFHVWSIDKWKLFFHVLREVKKKKKRFSRVKLYFLCEINK